MDGEAGDSIVAAGTRAFSRTVRNVLLGTVAALAVGGAVVGGQHAFAVWSARRAAAALFSELSATPDRLLEARSSYPLADRHRPFSRLRAHGARPAGPLLSPMKLVELERAADYQGIAAAHLLSGELDTADRWLDRSSSAGGSLPDVESDRAALLIEKDAAEEALDHLARALRVAPHHPQALWNRALALANLRLGMRAAQLFRQLAALDEPGWSDEARARAEELERGFEAEQQRWGAAERAAEGLAAGRLPPLAIARAYPTFIAYRLWEAVRARPEGHWTELAAALDELVGENRHRRLVAAARGGPADAEPLLEVLLLRARAIAARDRGELAVAERQLSGLVPRCDAAGLDYLCARLRLELAHVLVSRQQTSLSRRWALEAKHTSDEHGFLDLEARAHLGEQTAESFRFRFSIADAYAEENIARQTPCSVVKWSRELLAEDLFERGEDDAAAAQLRGVLACAPGEPRLGAVALGTLAELVRARDGRWPEGLLLLESELAEYRRGHPPGATGISLMLDVAYGRALIDHHPERGQTVLAAALAGASRIEDDVESARLRAHGFVALADAAAKGGRFDDALQLLARAAGATLPDRCALGAVSDRGREVFVARGSGTAAVGRRWRGPRDRLPAVPAELVAELRSCPAVSVLAMPPIFGSARLLPDQLAWAYGVPEGAPAPRHGGEKRLVVADVDPPPELHLPRLSPWQDRTASSEPALTVLRGPDATPEKVLALLPEYDQIEFHVHGVVNPAVSDAAALVLSAGRGGALLTATTVSASTLPRHPVVVLAACQSAHSPRYALLTGSLPAAFQKAGAATVIASPVPIEDREATDFFGRVRDRMNGGMSAAAAVRAERLDHSRWGARDDHWTNEVVVFQ
jgi:hypothetical protein